MEDASEALYLAGSVLIFIIALTITISSFTMVRAGIDDIVGSTEKVSIAKNSEGYINFIQSRNNGATRIVGIETVLSSTYRALKENYVVYIQFKTDTDANYSISADSDASINLNVYEDKEGKNILKFTVDKNDKVLRTNDNHLLNSNEYKELVKKLYNKLEGNQFYEYLGEYQNNSSAGVEEENKITNRIVTYKEV